MIGVFDSGVGGLSVWRELVARFPREPLIYLADQAHVPYGSRSLDEVRALSERCARWLIARGCGLVVVACNTASAAALDHLRTTFPEVAFVGMEPAVKPAALHTQTGVVGVLATATTFTSPRYADLVRRFAGDVRVVERACAGWVEFVERGGAVPGADGQPPADRAALDTSAVTSLLREGADVLVLGCTHFPFLSGAIRAEVERWQADHPGAPRAQVIDPAPAVADQALRVHQRSGRRAAAPEIAAPREYWTTGDPAAFSRVASALLRFDVAGRRVDL